MPKLTEAIFNFNKYQDSNRQRKIVLDMIKKYHNKGAEIVILGCTELAVIGYDYPKTLDPIDLLIEEIISTLYR